ncbi:MAG: tryptophanase, partial [Bdellovibrionales bacterium]|nr:tryptophanase [Bdellovibrionales bacterium]
TKSSQTHQRTIIEPFKIKVIEPLAQLSRAEREKALKAAHYNLFLLRSEHVTFDFLTDSGTTAMSAAQWAAMMVADESYAGSRSFHKFREVVQKITGYEHVIPTHQGRAAERLLFGMVIKPGMKVPSNNHFDTTRANIEAMGAQAVDLVIAEGKIPENEYPFKGNIDLARLDSFCREFKDKIPLGMLTITNNTGGGQPVSLENIHGAAKIYKKYGIPFILDACRFAENAYFIKSREGAQNDRKIPDIVRDVFDLADGCMMSAKKDGLVNIGGFIALKRADWVQDLRNQLILTEGFPTYGGLAARDLEALAVGLQEVLSEDYLRYRIATSNYMSRRLNEIGVPTVRPAGGHAVYIDAAKFLPHIPKEQFPGQALACEMYLQDGIRSCEIGSVMFKEAANMELVRMAFPRRVYTQSHFDYILEGFEELTARKNKLKGYRIVEAPPFLRHFTAKFALR